MPYAIATDKDEQRVRTLVNYAYKNGIYRAVQKAERDAARIKEPTKCSARADLLVRDGYPQLAKPFRDRYRQLGY